MFKAALFTLLAAGVPAPASAAVITINSSSARECYLAAVAELRTSDALATCDLALSQFSGDRDTVVATHVNRGIVRMLRGDGAAALADFDAAIALDADEPEAWFNRGVLLLRSPNRVGDAIAALDTALARGTRRPALAHLARGTAHETAGDARAAYRDYRRAEALVPGWDAPKRELRRFRVVRAGAGGSAAGSR